VAAASAAKAQAASDSASSVRRVGKAGIEGFRQL